jgi:hypothetical protein
MLNPVITFSLQGPSKVHERLKVSNWGGSCRSVRDRIRWRLRAPFPDLRDVVDVPTKLPSNLAQKIGSDLLKRAWMKLSCRPPDAQLGPAGREHRLGSGATCAQIAQWRIWI